MAAGSGCPSEVEEQPGSLCLLEVREDGAPAAGPAGSRQPRQPGEPDSSVACAPLAPAGLVAAAVSQDAGRAAGAHAQSHRLPADACYVLPTSGSTSQPKLVVGTAKGEASIGWRWSTPCCCLHACRQAESFSRPGHPFLHRLAGLLNRCHWAAEAHAFDSAQRVAFTTSPAFVDHFWQVLGTLLAGEPLFMLGLIDAGSASLGRHSCTTARRGACLPGGCF